MTGRLGGRVAFRFENRTITAQPGDTVAAALLRAGQTIFSRSFKYHRPRGLLCASGKCPNCLMNVDGIPNVRTCMEPVRDGMRVRSQNCWPSLERDWLSVIERFDFLLPVGFYYKMFARPRWAWKWAEPAIRRMAGLGRIASDAPREHFEHVHLHCEVAVLGGGPAGCSAALAAAEAGREVFLIDDQEDLGGHLRYYHRLTFAEPGDSGFEIARRLRDKVAAEPRIRVFHRALAFGAYEGGLLAIRQGRSLIHLRARKRIVATGSFEYPPSFDGNDLPGVMLASGVRRLIQLYGVSPGTQAVICGCDDDAQALALDLRDRGVAVQAVADSRQGHRIVRASGRKRVEAAELTGPDGGIRRVACDLIILAMQYAPSAELLRQSGVKFAYDEALHQMTPVEHVPDVFSAGRLLGLRHLEIEMLQGRLAGLRAASAPEGETEPALRSREEEFRSKLPGNRLVLLPDSGSQFVCLCEDVKQKDITRAIHEGFDELETLKRYSTVSMGPCQGRMCLMSAAALCAERTGRTLGETGSTTARPPVEPVPLGLLAGAHHHPVKLTPMHYRHVAAGASQMDMGLWKRPRIYTSEAEEWRAVRENAGIIDVSTLGKLDVKGRDSGGLLDKVYTHIFSELKPGRVRYGVICNDEGIILDDGTVSRLSDSHYFLTTTTGNVDFVEAWLNWWIAGTGLCVHVTNVTGDYAAVNLAGPKARDTLRKLTDADLAPESFQYMVCRQATVAGVPATLLRIGFVGETGWEIHYPACYGEYLWDALLEAGTEFGIRPFGVEAQRTLRLEKKHLIVGQDTDALSTPLEADMAWCIKFEKADFIGRPGLRFLQGRGQEQKLVGFISDSTTPIAEGSVVVDHDKPLGRVTSSRLSPYLGRWIGMAWVPLRCAAEGGKIQIRSGGRTLVARVLDQPFYDPEGKRLRE